MSETLKGIFQEAKNWKTANEGRIKNSGNLQQIMEIFICPFLCVEECLYLLCNKPTNVFK